MAIAGAGAGINELTALAVTSELAPTRKRGKYVAILVFTIIPFCPSVLWAQLIASHSSWRNCGAFCGAWAAAGLIMTTIFYFPPPRVNSKGLTRREVIKQIDFVGGFLSVTGMIVFMAGLQWGGYQVTSSYCENFAPTYANRRSLVFMAHGARPRPPLHRILPPCRLCDLGMEVCKISHVPSPPETVPSHPSPDSYHNFHQRRQFLLRPPVLANSSVQCLRAGSYRCGN